MANSFKYLSDNDKTVTRNTISSLVEHNRPFNTSVDGASNSNFMEYYIGDAETGEKIFDITYGDDDAGERNLILNLFKKILLGADHTGAFKEFVFSENENDVGQTYTDNNSNLGARVQYLYFITLNRSFFKDRIRNGSVDLCINLEGWNNTGLTNKFNLKDVKGEVRSPVKFCQTGTYGLLYLHKEDEATNVARTDYPVAGMVFYEAGIIVLSPFIFAKYVASNQPRQNLTENKFGILNQKFNVAITPSETIQDMISYLSDKIVSLKYHSVTEINSAVFFCRAFNHEFNYSSNPTYLNKSEIRVKNSDPEQPAFSYITTVGLYSEDNQLLAVAKLSEPVKKTQDNELVARVRIDF